MRNPFNCLVNVSYLIESRILFVRHALYIQAFEQGVCLEKGLSVKDTAFAVKVSINLILEYVNIMMDFKKHNGNIDRDVPDPYPIG